MRMNPKAQCKVDYRVTESRLLYAYVINDKAHRGLIKVGDVFVKNDAADGGPEELKQAVRAKLQGRSYLKGTDFEIKYAECTTYSDRSYKAEDVHRELSNNGIVRKAFRKIKGQDADIWFECTVDDIKKAVSKIKNGDGADNEIINLRPEQEEAVKQTASYFEKNAGKAYSYLWNAKMRFGKTVCGLEVARRRGYKATIIVTHRPVVDEGWQKDFKKIFDSDKVRDDYESRGIKPVYRTRMDDDDKTRKNDDNDSVNSLRDFKSLMGDVEGGRKILVFFVSMQYLRGSKYVGGKDQSENELKKAILTYDWDFVMVDEAHEGIEADAGRRVMEVMKKDKTHILSLSGTPFNLLEKYKTEQIYTWDYVREQRAKMEWDDEHYGDPNPYAELPRMNIFTFTMGKELRERAADDSGKFSFKEFFRVWDDKRINNLEARLAYEQDPGQRQRLQDELNDAKKKPGRFVHENDVRNFLDKLAEDSGDSLYPFSTDEFKNYFKHTFWLVPGVKEAAALEEMLSGHDCFGGFEIINVAGDGNMDDPGGKLIKKVKKKILEHDYTITLSCGKLTTGVTVPEWTAVLYMKGSESAPAQTYMQAAFRVQSPAVLEGRQKSDCYVFDFAPERALTAVAETSKMAVRNKADFTGKKSDAAVPLVLKLSKSAEQEQLGSFLELCPVISMDDGRMSRKVSAEEVYEKLNNVYIERAVRTGYADNSLYNAEKLMNLTPQQEKVLSQVREILAGQHNIEAPDKITINTNYDADAKDSDDIKYIYYLAKKDVLPARPLKLSIPDSDGRPAADGWFDEIVEPDAEFAYLYMSHSKLRSGSWSDFSVPVLKRRWIEPADRAEMDAEKKARQEERKERKARISVLRGVAIRIPLIMYGANIDDRNSDSELSVNNFTQLVDEESWKEFMPKDFTKEAFNALKDCFDDVIFRGAAKRIRSIVREADNLDIEDRIMRIACIFSCFHNPDKETVLTPWRVVNMHMSDTVGGWCFFNDDFSDSYGLYDVYDESVSDDGDDGSGSPVRSHRARFVDRGQVTRDVFGVYDEASKKMSHYPRLLEINSKTGLYPLYLAYSLFKAYEPEWRYHKLTNDRSRNGNFEQYANQAYEDSVIWETVLKDNLFVICRTEMAAMITKRTLSGFRDHKVNVKCYKHDISVNELVKAGVIKKNDPAITKNNKVYLYTVNNETRSSLPCDIINVLLTKPEYFEKDVVMGRNFWHLYQGFPLNPAEDINNMKFNAIVGNPPYQVNDGGGTGSSAIPLYNDFVNIAQSLYPNFISMIMPAKWYSSGRGLDEFRDKMLQDHRLSMLFDFEDSRDCFPSVDIAGGVCYFLWDKDYNGDCLTTSYQNGVRHSVYRRIGEYDVFIRNSFALSIIKKVENSDGGNMSSSVYMSNPFGLRSFFKGEEKEFDGSINLYGNQGISYVSKDKIPVNASLIDKWKLIMSKTSAEHAGQADKSGRKRIISKLEVLPPNTICTETYLLLKTFDNKEDAKNMQSYMRTQFVRFLLSTILLTQNVAKDKFRFIPLQDFTSSSDIDWNKSIADIDKQLYKKYGLSEEEIKFIEKKIKPMD